MCVSFLNTLLIFVTWNFMQIESMNDLLLDILFVELIHMCFSNCLSLHNMLLDDYNSHFSTAGPLVFVFISKNLYYMV